MASFEIFPPAAAQVGLAWGNKKRPVFSTAANRTSTLRENRVSMASLPLWEFDYSYNKMEATDAEDPENQLHACLGFFMARHGRYETFLIKDTEDYHIEQQLVGFGNGALNSFQIVRAYGEFVEPLFWIANPVDVPGHLNTLVVYVNGIEQGYVYDGKGLFHLENPPALGARITVTCDFYYRVRFVQDQVEVEQFVHNFFNMQNVELVSVKPGDE